MRLYNRWTPMSGTPAHTSIHQSQRIVYGPDRQPFGAVSTSVERVSQGMYVVTTLTYRIANSEVLTRSQRCIDSGVEFNLTAARERGERAHRQGQSELYAASRQEVGS